MIVNTQVGTDYNYNNEYPRILNQDELKNSLKVTFRLVDENSGYFIMNVPDMENIKTKFFLVNEGSLGQEGTSKFIILDESKYTIFMLEKYDDVNFCLRLNNEYIILDKYYNTFIITDKGNYTKDDMLLLEF